MRLLLIILLLVLAVPTAYAAGSVQSPQQQMDIAVRLFQKACLTNYGRPEKMTDFLQKYFAKQENKKAVALLELAKVQKGTAWSSQYPQGTYSVVQEHEGNCHVIAEHAVNNEVHKGVKALAQTAFKDLTQYLVDYREITKDGMFDKSGFDLKTKDDRTLMSVDATTAIDPTPSQPAAIISMTKK